MWFDKISAVDWIDNERMHALLTSSSSGRSMQPRKQNSPCPTCSHLSSWWSSARWASKSYPPDSSSDRRHLSRRQSSTSVCPARARRIHTPSSIAPLECRREVADLRASVTSSRRRSPALRRDHRCLGSVVWRIWVWWCSREFGRSRGEKGQGRRVNELRYFF